MPFPNKQQRQSNRQAYKTKQEQTKTARGKVIANFSPGMTAIRLFANGDIVATVHGSGSARGATAKVDQSGAKHVIRDTRQTFLTIEGPHIRLATKLSSNSGAIVKAARQFAAAVNQWSQSHPQTLVTAPTGANSRLEQLERLGKLRDSGVLSEEEFATEKAKLLASGDG